MVEERSYQVVFPYPTESTIEEDIRKEPSFNLIHGQCINAITVSHLYKTYQEAKQEAEAKNKENLSKKIGRIPFDSNFGERVKKLKQEYNEKLEQYNQFEKQIEKRTEDLIVKATPKEQTVIMMRGNKIKYLDISLYQFIELFDDSEENFSVYHVSSEEYEYLKQVVTNKARNFPLFESQCLLKNDLENNLIKICNSNLKGCLYLKDKNICYDELMNFNSEISTFGQEDNSIQIFTIETYEI